MNNDLVSTLPRAQTQTTDSKITKPKAKRNRKSNLTDEDKKKHHIISEHKRRAAIREAFEKLVTLVPSLKAEDAKSEITVLRGSSEFLLQLQKEYRRLTEKAKDQGTVLKSEWVVSVPDHEETLVGDGEDDEDDDYDESNIASVDVSRSQSMNEEEMSDDNSIR